MPMLVSTSWVGMVRVRVTGTKTSFVRVSTTDEPLTTVVAVSTTAEADDVTISVTSWLVVVMSVVKGTSLKSVLTAAVFCSK